MSPDVRKDQKANGLKEKTGTMKIIYITGLMMDAIAVHANTKHGCGLDKNEPGLFHQTSGKVQGN